MFSKSLLSTAQSDLAKRSLNSFDKNGSSQASYTQNGKKTKKTMLNRYSYTTSWNRVGEISKCRKLANAEEKEKEKCGLLVISHSILAPQFLLLT